MINYLPADTLQGLNCTQIKIVYHLMAMLQWHGQQSKSHAEYWEASQRTMAAKIGVSRTWLSTCIQKLHDLAIIHKMRRRREHGHWRTNLYRYGPRIVEILKGKKAAVKAWVDHVTSSKHIVRTQAFITNKERFQGGLQPISLRDEAADLSYLGSLFTKYGPGGECTD